MGLSPHFPFGLLRGLSRSVCAGPRTLCNACGLVYAKLVRQKNVFLQPQLLIICKPFLFGDDLRSKSGNEMPHVAQQTRRTRTTVPRPTRQGMGPAVMRMSQLLKSFGWMTSMGAVVDTTLVPLYLRLISDKHIHFRSSTLTLSISHLGELRLQYGLSISAFSHSSARFMGPAVPIRYTLMGLSSFFHLSRAHVLCSCACALILSTPGHHPRFCVHPNTGQRVLGFIFTELTPPSPL